MLLGTVAPIGSIASAQQHATTAPSAAAPAPAAHPTAPAPAAHPAPAAAPAHATAAPSPTEKFSDRYAMLAEKNIFVRNRPPTRTGSQQRSFTRRAEETMVLTGIALQEGRHVAFLEDSAARSTKRLLPGDAVAGGTIVAVNFDSLEFDANGKRIHIPVGRNLLGEIAPVAAAAETPSSSQPAVASTNSPERTAADRSSNGRSRYGSSNGNGRESGRDSRDRGSRDSRNGRESGRDSRESRFSPSPMQRDTMRERDPAGPMEMTVVPGAAPAPTAASPAVPNDPNLSFEERMKLRRQQLGGENK